MGAIALFGETYDDTVRIVEIGGPWSVELCGGTHVEHSSQIGPIAITAESSVGSGLRRVEAAVGIEAFHTLAAERTLVSQLAATLKAQPSELPGRIEALLERLRVAEKELAAVRAAQLAASAGELADAAVTVGDLALVAATAPAGTSAADVRSLASDVRGRLGGRPGAVAMFGPSNGTVAVSVAVTPSAVERGLVRRRADQGGVAARWTAGAAARRTSRREPAAGPPACPAAIERSARRSPRAAPDQDPPCSPGSSPDRPPERRASRGRRRYGSRGSRRQRSPRRAGHTGENRCQERLRGRRPG